MFNTKEEFFAYAEYLQTLYPDVYTKIKINTDLYAQIRNQSGRATKDVLNAMTYKAGLALGYTSKFLSDEGSGEIPLNVYTFLAAYRRDNKINDLLT